jgi:hypothetical protein
MAIGERGGTGLRIAAAVSGLGLVAACAGGGAAAEDALGGGGGDPATAPDGSSPSSGHGDGAAAGLDGRSPPVSDGAPPSTDDATTDGPAALPPMTMPAFVVGYNEAWFGSKYGTDLTTDFDLAYVNKTLDGIAKAGGHVMRLFLFELLQGITLGATPPQTQSLSPAMLANLGAVLDAARARGLWVYLTALEGNEMSKVVATKAYYQNLLADAAGEGAAFQTNVLAPLLALLDAHKDNVFGLDLMNEIDAPRNDGLWPDKVNGPRGFVQRNAAFVKGKSPWLRVTTTVGWGGVQYDLIAGFLSGLGLDFYDLHVYADSGSYPGATDLCARAASDGVPIYLGEFGQKTQQMDDNMQLSATSTFLSTAKSMCFKGALAWRYDSAENWWSYIRPDGTFRPAVSVMQAFGGP